MGSESYAYFTVEAEQVGSEELAELAAGLRPLRGARAASSGQVVARIDATSAIRQGTRAKLWFNPKKLHLFDPQRAPRSTPAEGSSRLGGRGFHTPSAGSG